MVLLVKTGKKRRSPLIHTKRKGFTLHNTVITEDVESCSFIDDKVDMESDNHNASSKSQQARRPASEVTFNTGIIQV